MQNILKRRPVEQGRGPSCSGLVLWPMAWETFHGEMEEWIQLNSNKFWKQTRHLEEEKKKRKVEKGWRGNMPPNPQ